MSDQIPNLKDKIKKAESISEQIKEESFFLDEIKESIANISTQKKIKEIKFKLEE